MKRLLWKRLLAMGVTATLLMSNPGVTALADEILPEDVSVSEEIIHDTGNIQENSKN